MTTTSTQKRGFWESVGDALSVAWTGIKKAAKATWDFLVRNSKTILDLSLSAASIILASNSRPQPRYGTRTTVVREHYRVNPDGRVSKVKAHARVVDDSGAYPYLGGTRRYRPSWEW